MNRESFEETYRRVVGLTENVDCGICTQPMDSTVAVNELARHLLGEDWYVAMPLNQLQINTEIVFAIERAYQRKRRMRRKAK